ncbi:MAG: S8 family serine peptidase [Hyphomonadaceae bacterium]|nr:S8 family serine peptidase [Hyphomonadaceae bacterium]
MSHSGKVAKPRHRPYLLLVAASLALPLAVSACASGGGGGGSMTQPLPPPPPPQPPSNFETREYNFTRGLALINASTAYSQGATGEGITVAVIDTGVDFTHPDLEGQSAGAFDTEIGNREPDDFDDGGHGTLVAGIIAAARDGEGIMGVAFESKILDIRADRSGSCLETGEDEGCRFPDSEISNAIDIAIAEGAQIINMSLGGEIDPNQTLENAVRRAAQAGILVVISAGNEAEPAGTDEDGNPTQAQGLSPNEPAYIAGQAASLGRVVAVGSVSALDNPGTLSAFSNRAGEDSKFYYLLAPGEDVVSTGPDDDIVFPDDPENDEDAEGDYYRVGGTSFAAPYVAGSLALLLDAFPNLAPEEALSILLDTADDYVDTEVDPVTGLTAGVGVDAVSGVGVLNLANAFTPQGQAQMALSIGRVDLAHAMSAAPSGAFGDWAEESGVFERIALIDQYGRAFDFDHTILQAEAAALDTDFAARADWAVGQSRAFAAGPVELNWHTPRLREDPSAPYQEEPEASFTARYSFAEGEVAFGRGGGLEQLAPRASLFRSQGDVDPFNTGGSWASFAHDFGEMRLDIFASDAEGRTASGLGFTRSGEGWTARASLAAITDTSSALGGQLQSRFGADDATHLTSYGLEGALDLPASWILSGGLEASSVDSPGLDTQDVWTSQWSLGASRLVGPGKLSFVLAQPRRAETGSLRLNAAVGANRDGLIFETLEAGLTPSGRQINLEARYGAALGDRLQGNITFALVREPNHVAGAEPGSALWLGLIQRW